MEPLLDTARMQKLDRFTIDEIGIPGAVLMETAGRGVVSKILERYGDLVGDGRILVLCGTGNNGGDGFVIARVLKNLGYKVTTALVGDVDKVKGDAKVHFGALIKSGGDLVAVTEGLSTECPGEDWALIVDALFGTGLTREVEGLAAKCIDEVNNTPVPVVSVDIPSGVSSDTGQALGRAVSADMTVTFAHFKKGHFLHPGRALSGEVSLVDIGIMPGHYLEEAPDLFLLEPSDLEGAFLRGEDSHKGHFGHVAVVAGSSGKMGAAHLAAAAVLKAGAGLVTAAYPGGLAAQVNFPPEVMTLPIGGELRWSAEMVTKLKQLISSVDAVVVGPGLGLDAETGEFFGQLLRLEGLPPVVLDADALTLVAGDRALLPGEIKEVVFTPHPGEAARMINSATEVIQGARELALLKLIDAFHGTVVLKGASTLIGAPGEPTLLIDRGNPGMSTAGSGDVLAGVIGALLARGIPTFHAASAGALLHGIAGDLAAEIEGVEGVTASDILRAIPEAFLAVEGFCNPGEV
ncbi:MAG: bifunctional ADP-dependent NAD(P)H-hydrate dehydratase/NAD(P)H-hydrate epimerase [Deltaproteobacteria bacterium]|nr:MAG: bifunctional ADP-dependent NAD(P)H-hydrate dehydratase/NAD(P)H-hydrate epimerase [Deltaproteobacteria bacterium]